MYQIVCGSQDIFNSASMGELPVLSARMSEQLNESGNLQFVLAAGHPLYNLLEPMASYVTAYEDDDVIFEGRVLEGGLPTFSGQITYDCEGALSFLMDSEVPPIKNPTTMTVQQFFAWCLAQHNSEIGNDPRRTFQAGNVTIADANKSEKFQITSYTQTKTAIENYLLNVYGGYLKIRYSNGVRYLDWVENYSDQVDTGAIIVGENVIEQAFSKSGENLFTVIRPIGKNGLTLDGVGTIDVFSSSDILNKYGRIVRTVNFSDAASKSDLQTKANEYIAKLKKSLLCSGSIQIVEMHYLDGTSPKIKMGARFSNIQGLEGTVMTISGRELDFMEPYKGDFSFGNDKSLSDGTPKGGGSISRATSRAGASAGMNYKHIIELGEMLEINAETLTMHGETLNQHYEQINQSANQIISLSNEYDNMDSRLQTVEGTGVIRNDELLAQFAGTMRLIKNEQGIVTGIEFVDGTMVMDTDEEGHMVTVGAAIAANAGAIQTIQGSGLWTQRDNITGVCGEFDIVEDPVTHVKTIVIKSGGGMKIREDNVEYGIYHDGNLKGGIIVDKLNNDTYVTKIRGDAIDLTTNDEYAGILITSSSIRSEIHSAKSDLWSAIEQTTTYIRQEVGRAAESITQSVIEQTAEYVRTEVSSVASGIAWSVITQTMTNIEQQIARKSKVYVQWNDPNNGYNELFEGDIWIKRATNRTWNAAMEAHEKWVQPGASWRSKYGDLQYVWRDNQWNLVMDTALDVENQVHFEQTDKSMAIIGRAVDTMNQNFDSKLEVTARSIRGEVSTARSQLYSTIMQTATNIRAVVANEVEGLQSSIEQTANSITTSVSAAKSAMYSTIMQTATNIRAVVASEVEGLQSSIEQTANSITTSVSAAKSSLYSTIMQTATGIYTNVTDYVSGNYSTILQTSTSIAMSVKSAKDELQSSIDIEKNRISLVVSGTGANAKIKPAEIAAAINAQTGQSKVRLSANILELDGYVKATDITANFISSKISLISTITAQAIEADSVKIRPVSGMGLVNVATAYNGSSLTLSGNTYTLRLAKMNGTYDEYSFSRATSLSARWDGSRHCICSASPQGNTLQATIESAVPKARTSWNGSAGTITLYGYIGDSETAQTVGTVSINGEGAYNAGVAYGYDANHKMFIGDANYSAKPGVVNVSPGSPVEVWPYFMTYDGQSYQWGPKYTFQAVNPHPNLFSLKCTGKTQTYPGSTLNNYTFELLGSGTNFSVNTSYNFYR